MTSIQSVQQEDGDNSLSYRDALEQIKDASLDDDDYAHVRFYDLSFVPQEVTSLADKRCYFDFYNCSLKGMETLKGLKNIRNLTLRFCRDLDTDVLGSITSLHSLGINSEHLNDVSFVESLQKLMSLDLSNCGIRDISPLRSLTSLARLDLSYTGVEELDALSALVDLNSLNLRRSKLRSIAPLASLASVSSLDISHTPVRDISALSSMRSLDVLRFDSTHASSVPTLKGCTSLRFISCRRTPLNRLDFLAETFSLETLDISGTRITDLSPLRKLHNLVWLSAAETSVSDLLPITDLGKLRRLDVSNTRVSDLSPLSELTFLARGPRGGRTGGLFFAGSPIEDLTVREMGSQKKADRAENVISYLREQQGLPSLWDSDSSLQSVPRIPSQEAGPHFTISEQGVVDFEHSANLDLSGNNLSRLRSLQPRIAQLARNLASSLSPNEQPQLLEVAEKYLNEIIKPLDTINFDLLYGEGLFLEEAAEAAKRNTISRISPPLEDASQASLNSLIRLHAIFILSSKAGLDNFELAQLYDSRPEIEKLRSEALLELANTLDVNRELASPNVTSYISNVAAHGYDVSMQKQGSFRSSIVRNLIIVITAGASIAALPSSGSVISGTAGGFIGAGAGYFVLEGLKKSAPFLEVSGLVKKGFDKLTEVEVSLLLERLKKTSLTPYFKFVEDNEDLLRRIASTYGRTKWLEDHLDWIKEVHDQLDK